MLTKQNFIKNRDKYFNIAEDNSVTILFSGRLINKTADEDFDFEVDKNFYYLTGINQDEVILVLLKSKNVRRSVLFIQENDPNYIKWYARKLYKEEATEISGIDEIYYLDAFDSFIFNSLNSTRLGNELYNKIYLNLERRNQVGYNTLALDYSKKLSKTYPDIKILNCYNLIVSLRMVKEDEEVELIKESIEVTKGGILELMKNSKAGLYEYQLESYFDQYIKYHGQRRNSFKTIAAGGVNATVLHYSKNNTVLKEDELVLFDLGCCSDFYISDITRVFPVSGKFSKRQKEVYEAVLHINKECIKFLHDGVTWKEYNDFANNLVGEACVKLGLIKDKSEFRKYYWHSIGHSIGLDTHDPSLNFLPITKGMTLTVEPGIYIEEEGIGVRIEDDVLITKNGCEVLSKEIIKEVEDIEEFMKNR